MEVRGERCLLDLLVIEVGEADVLHEAVVHEALHLAPRLLERRVPIERLPILGWGR